MVDRTDDGKGYIHFDLAIPRNNKEVSSSGKFLVKEGTFYSMGRSLFTPDDPIGDLIALLSSDLLPSPSSRLAQDPLEHMCLIDYCNQHTLAHGKTFPLAFSCLDNKPLSPAMDSFAMLKYLGNYHYCDSLGNQHSFLVSNKVPTQYSLVDLCVPILEDIEKQSSSIILVMEDMTMRMS